MDLGGWLQSLGLGQYEAAFRENAVDAEVLHDLTDQDLERLGVLLGHRRKLLRAIAALDGTPVSASPPQPSPVPPESTSTAASPVSAVAAAFGERRHVTVMFCDLVDSTGIAARLDAEEWRDLVGAYLDAASAAVTDMGGKVAKKLGDGLMALFGYPVAQENDAERAVRAALAIQRSLADLNRRNDGTEKPVLSVRIAIDSGPVVLDAVGEIFGDVPNVAARAQTLAEPSGIVVTGRVQRQVAGLFVAEARGNHALKGVPEPVALFRIVRASGGGHRAGQRNLTPLVGRNEEIAALLWRWERARQGDGQLALIVGEPGLGKSRLVEEFHARLREAPHTWVEWSCSQLLQNTPLHPFAEWGRIRFGGADAPTEQRLADLESSLAQVGLEQAENAALLAPLLDIPLPTERVLALTPEERRRRQLAALIGWMMAGARVQPVVLAVEDLHWADPTTVDLLRGIAERGALAPLFVLITARPEFRPPWSMRSHHTAISLVPLDRQQVRHMVGELSANHALAKEVVERITERTGGVPLFVEEVTLLLLELGEQGGIDEIPPTLRQSLTARLDRLGPAREVAQVGAVIGRDFSYSLLRAASGMEEGQLQAALERLVEADILLVHALPAEAQYRFKHALIQDSAYQNLLKSRRQALHRRIGEILLSEFATDAIAEPELLAYHFTEAGLSEVAVEWWGKAGQRSLERSALQEAIAQLTHALDHIATLPETPALRRERIKLVVALIYPLMHVKGHAAPETKAAVERARLLIEQADALGEPPEDPLLLFSVLYGFWLANYIAFDGSVMRELAAQFLILAEKQKATDALLIAHRITGISLVCTGEFSEGRAHLDQAIELYEPGRHRPLAIRFAVDAAGSILSYRSWALWILGWPAAALADAEQAINNARKMGHAVTLMHALGHAAFTYFHCGEHALANSQSEEAIALAADKGALFWKAWAMLNQGCVSVLTGRSSDAIEIISSGISIYRSTAATAHLPVYLTFLARAYADVRRLSDAWRCVDEALADVETTKEALYAAEVNHMAGKLALLESNQILAEAHFERALAVARAQQARSWELRAATSMAQLWRDQGKRTEARSILAFVYSWFTEGFDTLDLREAKALLDELAS
jgi:class 3 adenylate cyclase/tetratricopeptide (TPR) repeat protein